MPPRWLLRIRAAIRNVLKPVGDGLIGAITIGLLRFTRLFDPIRTANLFGRITRLIGPLLREHKTGRANLTAAFPEKSPEEIERILMGVWDNLGRVGAEFAHLDHIWDYDRANPEGSRVEIPERTHELFAKLRLDGKPALIFASHLGNWELPALAATAHELDTAVLFRRPNNPAADRAIHQLRSVKMGQLIAAGADAPVKLAHALDEGLHVAMLVDQWFTRGVDVEFFGRKTKANPTLARLLRQVECPVYGVRIVRLPNHRFRAELSEEITPARTESGAIDVQGTMQKITTVIEGWIREHPEQWLWVHRRWR